MRSGELIVVVVNALGIVLATFFSTRWRRALRFGAIVPPVVCLVQIGVEGARWQMVPAYLLSLIVAAMMLSPAGRHRIRLMAGALLTMLLAVALPVVLPVFRFPDPDGPYGIGTVTYHWTDTSRDEVFLETSAPRELMVQVWYPATKPVSSSARSHYVDHAAAFSTAETSVLASTGGVHLPRFFFDHFGNVTTNASPEAPAAAGDRFPVLLYATGLDGFRQANTAQVEYLVSRGYVVVGVDQPYTSAAIRFPDGRIVSGLSKPVLQPLIDQSIEPVSPPPSLHGVVQPDGIIPYLADDFRFTLDRLVDVDNSAPILAGRLDLSRVGMFGVSLGAMVTAQACHTDPRISACLMMDAAIPAPVAAGGLRQPAMWMTRSADDMRLERQRAGGWSEDGIRQTLDTMRTTFSNSGPAPRYYVTIDGMFHVNFTDAPFWSPLLSRVGLTGPIDGRRGTDILNTYTSAFFDSALLHQQSPLLQGEATAYVEVQLE